MFKIGPKWMKPAFDQRFIDMARQSSDLLEVEPLQARLRELDQRLKAELSEEQYKLVLEWEELNNTRTTIEKEWLYFAGCKDGIQLLRDLMSTSI
ncbi:hypothetical protein [Brevibacillus massiliensis]|uniref:hypothetical protein n=1 Tax=Brevibacillus massiliensis TaxID=1118054 RepID=UPI00037D2010|nr:hypothetical protein [Brevibacillus massiliensis]